MDADSKSFTHNNYKIIIGEQLSTVELEYWDPYIDTIIKRSIIISNEGLDDLIETYKLKGYKERV